MRDEEEVDSLATVLRDHNTSVSQEAIWALGKIGGAKALGELSPKPWLRRRINL
jgi:hypothetical protein